MYIKLFNSNRKNKRFAMRFYNKDKKLINTTHFGAKNGQTFIDHKNVKKRENYIKRHSALGTENWNNYKSAGALSRYILWGPYSDLEKAIKSYSNRFGLKLL